MLNLEQTLQQEVEYLQRCHENQNLEDDFSRKLTAHLKVVKNAQEEIDREYFSESSAFIKSYRLLAGILDTHWDSFDSEAFLKSLIISQIEVLSSLSHLEINQTLLRQYQDAVRCCLRSAINTSAKLNFLSKTEAEALCNSHSGSEIMSKLVALGWSSPMPSDGLNFDECQPLETIRHRITMTALIQSVQQVWAGRNDFVVDGNIPIYYDQEKPQKAYGPDFFVVLNVDGTKKRKTWKVWEENERYPNVIIELLSPKTAKSYKEHKKNVYEQIFHTPDYFIFDPYKPEKSLQGWHLDNFHNYQLLSPNDKGWLWCDSLNLWIGTWQGTIGQETAMWLRFYDQLGSLMLLPDELARQREQELTAVKLEAEITQKKIVRLLMRSLQSQFGEIPLASKLTLQALNSDQLIDLLDIAETTNSLEQFLSHLSSYVS